MDEVRRLASDYSEANAIGAVRPINRPVEVSIGPVRSFSAVTEYHAASSTGFDERGSMSFSGSIEEDGGQYLFRLRLTGFNSWRPAKPIAEAECWLSADGRFLGKPAVHLADLDQMGRRPSKDEAESVRDTMMMMLILWRPVPGTYARGAEVEIVPTATQQRLNNSSMQHMKSSFPDLVFDMKDGALHAEAIAMQFGRPAMLARYNTNGTTDSASAQYHASIKIDGYRLVDERSGLPLSWMIHGSGNGHSGDRPLTLEIISTWKVTAIEFAPASPARALR
jgi:hypothetical protein